MWDAYQGIGVTNKVSWIFCKKCVTDTYGLLSDNTGQWVMKQPRDEPPNNSQKTVERKYPRRNLKKTQTMKRDYKDI